HEGGPLGDGDLDDNVVTCPLHGWDYDVTNGENHTDPDLPVKAFDVTVEGSDIKIKI
ncbi:MAG: Rieske (2Fe-2S) protein, partial [Thaumarchaeota archaeon]|nr:Rieske (2Fe-2S) protein [Nitrososphaerota archaeon]